MIGRAVARFSFSAVNNNNNCDDNLSAAAAIVTLRGGRSAVSYYSAIDGHLMVMVIILCGCEKAEL